MNYRLEKFNQPHVNFNLKNTMKRLSFQMRIFETVISGKFGNSGY